MKLRWLIALGGFGFLCGALMRAPAGTLAFYGWLKPAAQGAPAAEVYGLQGTVGAGELTGMQIGNRRLLLDLHWQFHPLWLLLGQARFHITGSGNETSTQGDIGFAPFHTIRLHAFQASGAIKPLLAAAGQAFLPVDGKAGVDADDIVFKNGIPQKLAGTVRVQQLVWTLARDPVPLGDFQAVVSPDHGDSLAKIESTGGPMELAGDARFAADQSYTVDLKFRLKPDATPMLRNLVAGAGAPDAQGWYHLRQSGKLK